MNIFERGLAAVFASGQHGGLSEMSNSDGKDCKQQIKYLWPGRFVKKNKLKTKYVKKRAQNFPQ